MNIPMLSKRKNKDPVDFDYGARGDYCRSQAPPNVASITFPEKQVVLEPGVVTCRCKPCHGFANRGAPGNGGSDGGLEIQRILHEEIRKVLSVSV
jgi:hypothetical protein